MKKEMPKKGKGKVTEFTVDISIMHVEECGYKATFTEKEHREFVSHVLAKLEGYKMMIFTLSKAIDLIAKD